MKNWIFLIAAAFLFFSGCLEDESIVPMDENALVTLTDETTMIGEAIILTFNETVMITPDGFTVTFADVPEDNRCPTGVACIWEGRAVIKLVFKNRKESQEAFLETPNSIEAYGQAVNVFGRTIKLIDVAPYPYKDIPITLKQYRATILADELELLDDIN